MEVEVTAVEIFRTRKCSFDTLGFEGIIKKCVVVFSVYLFCFIFSGMNYYFKQSKLTYSTSLAWMLKEG